MSNLVKCEGELVIRDGSGIMMEFYEEEFILDDSINTIPEARALIRRGLITERLQRKVDGFKRVRTCTVTELTPSDEAPEDSELTRVMMQAIELGCVPVNIDNYKRPDYKLKALQKAIETHLQRKPEKDKTQYLGEVDG